MNSIQTSLRILVLAVVAFLTPAQALALNLTDALEIVPHLKVQGELGEAQNGYLNVVRDGGQANEVAYLVNRHRKEEYERTALQNGLSLTEVESMFGQANINRAPSGHYVRQNGEWVKKP